MGRRRTADPWRDTDVIDSRAPRFNQLDVRGRPDLARKYGIAVVPTVLAIAADGTVLERLAP